MISNAKPVFALSDTANHVIDIGNNLILGGKYYNKDLSPALVSEAWTPETPSPLTMYGNSSTYNTVRPSYGYGSWVAPFLLRGNSSFAWYDRYLGVGVKYTGHPSNQTRMADVFSPYFDSTMGSTDGKRLVGLPRAGLYQVTGTGSLQLLNQQSSAISLDSYMAAGSDIYFIFGESVTNLYVLRILQHTTSGYQANLYKVSKSDYTYTVLTGGGTASDQRTIRFMGISADNKALFVYVPQAPSSANWNTLSYAVIDLTAGTGAFSSVPLAIGGSAATLYGVGIGVSSLIPDIQDTANNHYYLPIVGGAVGTDTIIARVKVPKTLAAKVNPVAGDVTNCTITDMPVGQSLINPALNPVSSTAVSELTILTKYDGSNEYLIVINHGFEAGVVSSNNLLTDNCGTTRFAFFVFLVDPTNSANLIYKQSLYINDIGGQVPFMVNASIDRNVLALGCLTQVVPFKWNAVTETYTVGKVISIPAYVQRLGIDDQNQILVEDGANKLYVFQLDNSIDVSIVFAGNVTSLNYTGTPLSVDVLVNTYDMNNNRVAKTVALNVQNAIFTSTSTANATVTTSASADTVVNITINAGGQVVVTPISVT